MESVDIDILYEISGDLEMTACPFKAIGERVGISESEVIDRVSKMQELGMIKRIAPVLYHTKAEFTCNAMTIWQIDDTHLSEIAGFLMSFQHISHVYSRETCPEWPYNLYGMVHAKHPDEIDDLVNKILAKTGPVPYKVVSTTKEWKKTSPDLRHLLEAFD